MSRPPPVLPDPSLRGTVLLGSRELARAARKAPLLVALSGGADSTALLVSLVRLRAWLGAKPPFGLVAAHFHHGIRGAAADADLAFCRDLCGSLGVPLREGRGDVPRAAAATGESPEMAARRLRRAFLAETAAAAGAEAVATGHTLDDQVELFFLRLARGAGLRGLGGMPPLSPAAPGRPAVARPLLGLRHAALRAFLRAEGVAWREDATNADESVPRNRVRRRLVPAFLDACGSAAPAALARTMSLLREDADLLDSLARGGVADPATPPLARRRLAAGLYEAGADPETVSLASLERLRALAAGGKAGRVAFGGVEAEVRRGAVAFVRAGSAEAPAEGTPFVLPERLPAGKPAPVDPERTLSAARGAAVERPPRGGFLARPVSCTADAAALAGRRLVLRAWRPGDRIAVAGGRGTRKLSDVFTDAKLPRADRARVRLLADAATGAVLWLPGHGVAREAAVRPGAPFVRLVLAEDPQP